MKEKTNTKSEFICAESGICRTTTINHDRYRKPMYMSVDSTNNMCLSSRERSQSVLRRLRTCCVNPIFEACVHHGGRHPGKNLAHKNLRCALTNGLRAYHI